MQEARRMSWTKLPAGGSILASAAPLQTAVQAQMSLEIDELLEHKGRQSSSKPPIGTNTALPEKGFRRESTIDVWSNLPSHLNDRSARQVRYVIDL